MVKEIIRYPETSRRVHGSSEAWATRAVHREPQTPPPSPPAAAPGDTTNRRVPTAVLRDSGLAIRNVSLGLLHTLRRAGRDGGGPERLDLFTN